MRNKDDIVDENRQKRRMALPLIAISREEKKSDDCYYSYDDFEQEFGIKKATMAGYINRFTKLHSFPIRIRKSESNSRILEMNFNDLADLFRMEIRVRMPLNVLKIAKSDKFRKTCYMTFREMADYFEIDAHDLRMLERNHSNDLNFHPKAFREPGKRLEIDVNEFIELCRMVAIARGYPQGELGQ